MLKNYFITALRNFRREKISSSVSIAGLAIGMACCMLIIVYIKDELSYDKYNANIKNIYRINWSRNNDGELSTDATRPVPLGPAISAQVPAIEHMARIYSRSGEMRSDSNLSVGKRF